MAVGLRWHYDVTGAEPIIRDIRVYNAGSALSKGTCMAYGPVATAENCGAAIIVDPEDLDNVIGVLQEDIAAASLSVVATGVDYYGKIIINPFAVWLGQYSEHADDDSLNTSASSTGKVLTATMVTDHERGWAYITDTGSSSGGFGNLFQIGASSTTASITAATSYDDNLAANTTSDTFIVMPAPYSADVAGGSIDLSAASGIAAMQLAGYNSDAAAGAGIILENYMEGKSKPLQPLTAALHSGNNYKGDDPKFFGDLMFSEHLLCGGGQVNNRVIT